GSSTRGRDQGYLVIVADGPTGRTHAGTEDAEGARTRTRGSAVRGRPRQEPVRIQKLTVCDDLVVKMRSGRASGRTDVTDHLPAADRLSWFDGKPAQVSVTRHETETVVEDHEIAVVAGVSSRLHSAVGGSQNRLALFERDVEALVKPGLTRKRIV